MVAINNIVVDRYELRASAIGVSEAVAGTNRLTAATDQASAAADRSVISTEKVTRSRVSVAGSLERLKRGYDAEHSASTKMAAAQRTLDRSFEQGLVTLREHERLMGMVTARHSVATAVASQVAAANDNTTGSFSRLTGILRSAEPAMARLGVGGLAAGVGLGVAAAGLLAIGATIGSVVAAGDAWAGFENRLKAAGVATGAVTDVTRDLAQMAVATRAPLAETISLYARLTRVSSDLGITQADVRRGTEVLSRSIANSGLSTAEAASGLLQLSQALQSGRLQGDELRSILENMPDIAKAIAREFKTTVGALKDLGSEGELTSARVFSAILKAGPEIDSAFAKVTPTIETASVAAKSAMTLLGSEIDRVLGLSPRIAALIKSTADAAAASAARLGKFADDAPDRAVGNVRSRITSIETSELPFFSQLGSGGAAEVKRLEAELVSLRRQVDVTAQSFPQLAERITTAVGAAQPPARMMTDELASLAREAERAAATVPGLSGAVAGLGTAAGAAAVQLANVAAGMKAIQGLNPDLSGVLGYLDKVSQVNNTYEATRAKIMQGFGESGSNDEAAKQLTDLVRERTAALKALDEQRNKPANDYVRQGELAGMTELNASIGKNADAYKTLREARGREWDEIVKRAASPADAQALRVQADAELAKLDSASKLLDAKTRADAAKKGASSGSSTDAFDTALQRSKDQVREYKEQADAASRTSEEVYRLTEANRLRRAATSAGRDIDDELTKTIDAQSDAYARQRIATDRALEAQRRLQEGQRALGDAFSTFVEGMLTGSGRMSDAAASLGKTFTSGGLQAILTGQGPFAGMLGTAPSDKGQLGGIFDPQFFSRITKSFQTGFSGSLRELQGPTQSGEPLGATGSGVNFGGIGAAGLGLVAAYGAGTQARSPMMGAASGALAGAVGGSQFGPLGAIGGGLLGAAAGIAGGKVSTSKGVRHERRERLRRFRASLPAHG